MGIGSWTVEAVAMGLCQPKEGASPAAHEVARREAGKDGDVAKVVRAIALNLSWWLVAVVTVGVGVNKSAWESASMVLAESALVAAACFASGGPLGFLFGTPKSNTLRATAAAHMAYASSQEEVAAAAKENRPRPNTNIEKISDWLSEILVGVGLIQLRDWPVGCGARLHPLTIQPARLRLRNTRRRSS